MQKIPLEERPRERLFYVGEEALSDAELLAIILGSGTSKISVMELAHTLLSEFGGLASLSQASIEQLCCVHGVGKVKAVELRAVFSLVKRLLKKKRGHQQRIETAEDAYYALCDLFYGEKKEIVAALFLDSRLNLIGREVISIGSMTEVVLHPRELFKPAIQRGAHSLIIAHNHPSGDLTPSPADCEMTQRLILAGSVLEIEIKDHLIICNHHFQSFNRGVVEKV